MDEINTQNKYPISEREIVEKVNEIVRWINSKKDQLL